MNILIIITPCYYTKLGLSNLLVDHCISLHLFSNVYEAQKTLSEAEGFLLLDMNNILSQELMILMCQLRTRGIQSRWRLGALIDTPFANYIATKFLHPQIRDWMFSAYQSKSSLKIKCRKWLASNAGMNKYEHYTSLTELESRALEGMAVGKRLIDIARLEGKSPKTINTFQNKALRKLDMKTSHEFRRLCSGIVNGLNRTQKL